MPSKQSGLGNPATGRYAGIGRGGRVGSLSFGQCDRALLSDCVDAVVAAGDAVMFSKTSSGDAFVILIVSDGLNHKWYPTSVDECDSLLGELVDSHTPQKGPAAS